MKKKILAAFIVVGIVNILGMSILIYVKTELTLINQEKEHLISINSLASNKLSLYFSNLKLKLERDKIKNLLEITRICKFTTDSLDCPHSNFTKSLPNKTFSWWQDQYFAFRNGNNIYILNNSGINSVLNERRGLGNTGEIYLVGNDSKVKSASRFLDASYDLSLNNEVFKKSLKGESGVDFDLDYRGVKVLSAYSLFKFGNLSLSLLSEKDVAEIVRPLKDVEFDLYFLGTGLSILGLVIMFFIIKKYIHEMASLQKEKEESASLMAMNVLKIQEQERERIAYTLHDSVGQSMTALKWGLTQIKEMQSVNEMRSKTVKLVNLSEDIIDEIREISQDAMPIILKDFGCFIAIKEYVKKQSDLFSFQIELDIIEDIFKIKLSHAFELNLFRIIQELIQNAAKHSQASKVAFRILRHEEFLVLHYKDNGVGYGINIIEPKSLTYRTQIFHGSIFRNKDLKQGTEFEFKFKLNDILNE